MNIVICFTPLHVVIAKRIIEKKALKATVAIYFTEVDNDKARHYFHEISAVADHGYYLPLRKKVSDLLALLRLFSLIRRLPSFPDHNDFYTGNPKTLYSRLTMFMLGYSRIFSFDDGSGNICNDGYFDSDRENKISTLLFTVLDRNLLYKEIRKKIATHYTIYSLPNAFSQCEYIGNIHGCTANSNPTAANINDVFLLTNAFAEDGEMSLEEEIALYGKIVVKYGITHVIRHPRERLNKLLPPSVKVVSTPLIAEDNILRASQGSNVTVVGIYSTVLLNLANAGNLKLVNVNAKLNKKVDELSLIFSRLGISNEEV